MQMEKTALGGLQTFACTGLNVSGCVCACVCCSVLVWCEPASRPANVLLAAASTVLGSCKLQEMVMQLVNGVLRSVLLMMGIRGHGSAFVS